MIDAQFYFSAIYAISQLQEQCHVEVTKVVIVRARAITLRTATPLTPLRILPLSIDVPKVLEK
jgi:hypothetical protein